MLDPLPEALISIGAASALGIALNFVLIAFQKRNPRHPLFTMVVDDGGVASQMWTFLISMAFQALVYLPAVLLAAIQWRSVQADAVAAGTSVEELVRWEWKPGGLFPGVGEENRTVELLALRIYFYVFCGYLVRDTMMQLREEKKRYLMLLHHVVCIGGIVLGLSTPTGGTAVALGTFSFEVGSFFYNAWVVDKSMRSYTTWCYWPRGEGFVGRPLPFLYCFVFTTSNVIGGYLLAVAVWSNYEAGNAFFAVRYTARHFFFLHRCTPIHCLQSRIYHPCWYSVGCCLPGSIFHQRLAVAGNASTRDQRLHALGYTRSAQSV